MNFLKKVRKPLAVLMVLTFTVLTVAWQPAQAAMVGTSQILKQNQEDHHRDRLRSLLDRAEVRAQLEAWGVDSHIAKARINSLTNEEVAAIVERLDQLPAGGDGFGVLVGAALLVFIILLLTDILGYTDIFPFVKKQ
ncbi:MAG: PA2779 family protein [Desulfobacteraceae bacterium]|nr:MAG: PA2779 family protein [Desulfobacteraceae bacterium]